MLSGILLAALAGLALAQHYDDPNYVHKIVTRVQEPLLIKDKKSGVYSGYIQELVGNLSIKLNFLEKK